MNTEHIYDDNGSEYILIDSRSYYEERSLIADYVAGIAEALADRRKVDREKLDHCTEELCEIFGIGFPQSPSPESMKEHLRSQRDVLDFLTNKRS